MAYRSRKNQIRGRRSGYGQRTRRFFALFVFYLVTGFQIAATSPALSDLLHDQPGGVRQCSRKIAGGKEDRIARSWHRNFQTGSVLDICR